MRGVVLALVLLLTWNRGAVDSVRIVELRVAAHMAEGGTALLGCLFDLGGEALYSLKWYKDGREFFRYVPKGQPHMKTFFVPGVMVDLNRSSVSVVALKRLTRDSAGAYQCEVKAEAPTFSMVSEEKNVVIDLLPKWGPKILGLQSDYQIGSEMNVNCTTAPSRPEAQLQWLVNGVPAPSSHQRGPYLVIPTDHPFTYQTKLTLAFTLQAEHFDEQGAMTLKCQATIPPLYHQEKEYTFYEHTFETTTEISTDAVATTDIPILLLIIQMISLFLVN